jgi:hypothetical protein
MMRRTPYTPPTKWNVRDLRNVRAAYSVASMEMRVTKAEQEVARIEQAIDHLRDTIRADEGRPQSATGLGTIRQEQASCSHAYSVRRWELKREADLARQRLETEQKILKELKEKLHADGYTEDEMEQSRRKKGFPKVR